MPLSDCEVRDPRIKRTRQLLQSALRKLMESRSFDDIAVQDITEAATVNRATFYDHYTDKYALLEAMVAGGFHQFLHERRISYDGTCPSGVQALILATCDYVTQSRTGHPECKGYGGFEPLIEAAMTSAIRRILLAGMPGTFNGSPLSPEMIATMASWAIFGAVKEWFNTPGHASAEEVAPLIVQLVMPMLGGATSQERLPLVAEQATTNSGR